MPGSSVVRESRCHLPIAGTRKLRRIGDQVFHGIHDIFYLHDLTSSGKSWFSWVK